MNTVTPIVSVYVGCALTDAPDHFLREIKLFREKIAMLPGVVLKEFCTPLTAEGKGASDHTPEEVYRIDILEGVHMIDLLISDFTYSTSGGGFELAESLREGKRAVIMAKEGVYVSKLILGVPKHHTFASQIRYKENPVELVDNISSLIEYIRSQKMKEH